MQQCLNDKYRLDLWFNGALVYTESRHNYSELLRLSTLFRAPHSRSCNVLAECCSMRWHFCLEEGRRSATICFGFIAKALLQRIIHERSMAVFETEHVVIYSDHDQVFLFYCSIHFKICKYWKNHGRNSGGNKSHRFKPLDINWFSTWQMWNDKSRRSGDKSSRVLVTNVGLRWSSY